LLEGDPFLSELIEDGFHDEDLKIAGEVVRTWGAGDEDKFTQTELDGGR
jgi:hypothetical protein